ncbi:hypothetical protein ACVWXM_000695 [Bradyrhizobium sp. GM7.3]
MALEAGNLAVVPKHALAGIDDADGLAFGLQDRALLDVQFDEATELLEPDRLVAAITDAIERLADGGAISVLARQDVIGGEVADIGSGGHHRGSEARTLFVGPVDDADRRLGFDPGVVQRADHFERTERSQNAVILAAGRLRVEMRADADGRLRHVASLAQPELRAERIGVHLQAGVLAGLAEPVAYQLVLRAQRQPPHAALGRRAELRGLVDGAPEAGGIDLQIGGGSAHAVSLSIVRRLFQ